MIPFSIISCISCFTLLKGGIHGEEISFPGSLFFEDLLLGVQLDRLSNLTVSIPFFLQEAYFLKVSFWVYS